MKPETSFRANQVRPFLKTLRHTVAIPVQQLAIRGDPDFILCVRGLFVALELKARGGKVTPLQEYRLKEIRERGEGVVLVANPDNWHEIRSKLQQLDGGIR